MDPARLALHFCEDHGITLVTAESCTCGLVAGILADVPGSGAVLTGGLITYSPQAKRTFLKISGQTLEDNNLTSETVACEMAKGALERSSANCALANTGIAGPTPGEGGVPPGTVCFAWAFRTTNPSEPVVVLTTTRHLSGTRNEVRRNAARHMLEGIATAYGKVIDGQHRLARVSKRRS